LAEESDNVLKEDPVEAADSTETVIEDEGGSEDVVDGEIVDGDLVEGEVLVPDGWGDLTDELDESPDGDATTEAAGADVRTEALSEGALPSDLDIELLGSEAVGNPSDEDADGASFDFGEKLDVEESDFLDGLVFDEDSIGTSRRQPEVDAGGLDSDQDDELAGALPDDLSIDMDDDSLDDGSLVDAISGPSPPSDEFDLWSASLDGGWKAGGRPLEPLRQTVRDELLEHGVGVEEYEVPLAPIYGGTASFEAQLVDRSLSEGTEDSAEPQDEGSLGDESPLIQQQVANVSPMDDTFEIRSVDDLFSAAEQAATVSIGLAERAGRRATPSLPPALPKELDIVEVPEDVADDLIAIDLELDDDDVTFLFAEGLEPVSDVDPQRDFQVVPVQDSQVEFEVLENPLLGPFGDLAHPSAETLSQAILSKKDEAGLAPSLETDAHLPGSRLGDIDLSLLRQIAHKSADPLLAFLIGEIEVEERPQHLARALHAFGRLALERGHLVQGQAKELLLQAYRNAPEFQANDALLQCLFVSDGDEQGLIEHLDTDHDPRAGYAHQLYHLKRLDPAFAPNVGSSLSRVGVDVALATYLDAIARFDWETAASALDVVLSNTRDAGLRGAMNIEKIRLAAELDHAVPLVDWCLAGLTENPDVAAACAVAELVSLENGHSEGLIRTLQRQYASDVEAGEKSHGVLSVLLKLARAFEQGGLINEALHTYSAYLNAPGGDVRYALEKASELSLQSGRFDDYRQYLDALSEVVDAPAARAQRHYEMGLFLQRQQSDEAGAIAAFQRALEAMPTFTPALSRLSRYSILQGRFEEINQRFIDEIHQLETVLQQGVAAETRDRSVGGLVRRYYRLASNLHRSGRYERATDLHKRALALDSDWAPALSALSIDLSEEGDWDGLVALLLGWALRGRVGDEATTEAVLHAADVALTKQNDIDAARRLLSRVLNTAPTHDYALRRARRVFAQSSQVPEQIEVQMRLADLVDGHRRSELRMSSALLAELSGTVDGAAMVAEAQYLAALDDGNASPILVDGLLRMSGLSGSLKNLDDARSTALSGSELALPILGMRSGYNELLFGRLDRARSLVEHQRQVGHGAGTLTEPAEVTLLLMKLAAFYLEDDWAGQVDTLDELSHVYKADERVRECLYKAAEITERFLGDLEGAAGYLERVLDSADHDAVAQAGLNRLGAYPAQHEEADLPELVATNVSSEHESKGAFEARVEEFKRLGQSSKLVDALKSRSAKCDDLERLDLLRRLMGRHLALNRTGLAVAIAKDVLTLDPEDLTARFVLRRVESLRGHQSAASQHKQDIADRLQSKVGRAQVLYEQGVAPPEDIDGLSNALQALKGAVQEEPDNLDIAARLEAALKAAGDWNQLDSHFREQLKSIKDGAKRLKIAEKRARLLAEQFGESRSAFQLLETEFENHEPELPLMLYAGELAYTADLMEEGDGIFEQALVNTAPAEHRSILIRQGQTCLTAGFNERAGEAAQRLLEKDVNDSDALQIRAETAAAMHDWKAAVLAMRRIIALHSDDSVKAKNAAGIGEVFSLVFNEPAKAAAWYRRAVEFDPENAAYLRRLVDESLSLGSEGPHLELVSDGLDQAIGARRTRLAAEGARLDLVEDLAELYELTGDAVPQWRCQQLTRFLSGYNSPSGEDVAPKFEQLELSGSAQARLFAHHERPALLADVFEKIWPVLAEISIQQMPAGMPRLSRRSYRDWQVEFSQLGSLLGMAGVEVWNGGRGLDGVWGTYLPQAALAVPLSILEAPLSPTSACELGFSLEQLRHGGLLLDRLGADWLADAFWAAANQDSALLAGLDERSVRFAKRVERLPRRVKAEFGAVCMDKGQLISQLGQLERARIEECDRASLLTCDDIYTALFRLLGDGLRAVQREDARRAAYVANARAMKLASFYLGQGYAQLRPGQGWEGLM